MSRPATRPVAPAVPRPAGRSARALAVLGAAVALAACGEDDLLLGNRSDTVSDTLAVYTLSAGDPALPAGIDLFSGLSVRPRVQGGGLVTFDLAVDLDAQRRVRLVPAAVLVAAPGTPRTGLQVVAEPFAALTRAPTEGYRYDSATVAAPGQTVAVELQGVGGAQGLFCPTSSPARAKLVVDSVTAANVVWVRTLVNRNCGLRSLQPGRPTN